MLRPATAVWNIALQLRMARRSIGAAPEAIEVGDE